MDAHQVTAAFRLLSFSLIVAVTRLAECIIIPVLRAGEGAGGRVPTGVGFRSERPFRGPPRSSALSRLRDRFLPSVVTSGFLQRGPSASEVCHSVRLYERLDDAERRGRLPDGRRRGKGRVKTAIRNRRRVLHRLLRGVPAARLRGRRPAPLSASSALVSPHGPYPGPLGALDRCHLNRLSHPLRQAERVPQAVGVRETPGERTNALVVGEVGRG